MHNYLNICFLLFLLSPKVDLFSFSSSGVRPEDIFFLFALPVAFSKMKYRLINIPLFVKSYFYYLLACLLSSVINFEIVGGTGFIFTARQLQYFAWFLVGVKLASIHDKSFENGLNISSIVLILWAAGEFMGLIPRIGKFSGVIERISVNSSGPYEISIIVSILLLIRLSFLVRAAMLIILLATQARVTLLACIFVYSLRRPAISLLAFIFFITSIWIFSHTTELLLSNSRIGQTDSIGEMLSVLQRSWNTTWAIVRLEDYFSNTYDGLEYFLSSNGDISFQIRTIRWSFIIHSWLSDWFHFLFGWGPGAWSVAVDGNYVRIVGETGVVGSVAFLSFLYHAVYYRSKSRIVSDSVIIIAISSLFIDAAVSSKVMTLFWVLAGRESAKASLFFRKST